MAEHNLHTRRDQPRFRHLPVLAVAGALVVAAAAGVVLVREVPPPAQRTAAGGTAAGGTDASRPARSPDPTAHADVRPAPLDDADRGGKVVYLSFDDGPHPQYTGQVLDLLDQHRVKATFFQNGQHIVEHPDLTRRAHEAGHSIQNHTWSHPDLRKVSAPELESEVTKTDEKIREHTGYEPKCLRPPYGATNQQVKSLATAMGKKIRLWTIDTEDWRTADARTIAAEVLDNVQPESIVLMHDGGGDRSETVAALPTIISGLKARGYSFAPLWCK